MINEQLVKKVQDGDIDTRNKLIEHYQYIIQWICNKFSHNRLDKDTVRYGATIGLIHAIYNYDESKNVEFDRYAYLCAKYTAIKEMEKDWLIKLNPVKLRKLLQNNEQPFTRFDIHKLYSTNESEQKMYHPKELIYYDTYKDVDIYKIIKNELSNLTELEKDCIVYKGGISNFTMRYLAKKHNVSPNWIHLKGVQLLQSFRLKIKQKIKEQYEV